MSQNILFRIRGRIGINGLPKPCSRYLLRLLIACLVFSWWIVRRELHIMDNASGIAGVFVGTSVLVSLILGGGWTIAAIIEGISWIRRNGIGRTIYLAWDLKDDQPYYLSIKPEVTEKYKPYVPFRSLEGTTESLFLHQPVLQLRIGGWFKKTSVLYADRNNTGWKVECWDPRQGITLHDGTDSICCKDPRDTLRILQHTSVFHLAEAASRSQAADERLHELEIELETIKSESSNAKALIHTTILALGNRALIGRSPKARQLREAIKSSVRHHHLTPDAREVEKAKVSHEVLKTHCEGKSQTVA